MSEIQIHEQILSPERLQQQEAYFSAVATSEAHALTFVLMACSDGTFSRNDLRKEFMAAQGSEPTWNIGSNTTFKYAEQSFTRGGLVSMGNESRQLFNRKSPVEVYVAQLSAPAQDVEFTLAEAGALLLWSLNSESLGMRQLFGEDRGSDARNGGTLSRRRIVETVLDLPGISETELAELIDTPRNRVNDYVAQLQAHGVILKEDASDWGNRVLKLTGKGFRHTALERSTLRPETRAVYDMVDILVASGQEETTAQEIFDMTYDNSPGLDPLVIQEVVGHALVPHKKYLQGGRVKETKSIPAVDVVSTFNGGQKTKHYIATEHLESLKNLFAELKRIETGDTDAVRQYADIARAIAADKTKVRYLVEKAKDSSPQASVVSDSELLSRIDMVIQDGPLSIKGLTTALTEKGIVMSANGLETKVRELAEQGRLAIEHKKVSAKSRAVIKFVAGVVPDSHR